LIKLGVNVDHVATLRQARGTSYPDPIEAALLAIEGGADQITIHLREDRRHIQDHDLVRMKSSIDVPLNLEMAAADDIIAAAVKIRPDTVTLVPEKRNELTTEGGLDVVSAPSKLSECVSKLRDSGILVSMFIDPEASQVDASISIGITAVEFHTGSFCDAVNEIRASAELERLLLASRYAASKGLKVCAGHGLNTKNTPTVVRAIPEIVEYNIGHSIIARSVFVGMREAVREMKEILFAGGRK